MHSKCPFLATKPSLLLSLPSEIVHNILTFLPLSDLLSVSLVNRALRQHSLQDTLYHPIVQSQVPGATLSKPSGSSWRELFKSHHPYWFIPRNKLWFADSVYTGKLIIARYDHRIGAIEAYALVAERLPPTVIIWDWNPDVIIHSFNPRVQLDLNIPVLRLDAYAYERVAAEFGPRMQKEVPLDVYDDSPRSTATLHSRLMLTRPWPVAITIENTRVWPPLILPSPMRTRNDSPSQFRDSLHRPSRLDELSDATFRIRRWMEFAAPPQGVSMRVGEEITTWGTIPEECYTPTLQKPWQGIWVGDYAGHGCEFLAILQPDNPRPLPEKALRPTGPRDREGSSGSAESWSTAPTGEEVANNEQADLFNAANSASDLEDSVAPLQAAAHEGFLSKGKGKVKQEEFIPSKQEEDESVYHGRLEAIKLTGDHNVPRGQYTFIAPDIGPEGLIRIATEDMFKGARIVKSVGHIASTGFTSDDYITSQLILISHDRLAQYWETFGHVSFYQRVNIDEFTSV